MTFRPQNGFVLFLYTTITNPGHILGGFSYCLPKAGGEADNVPMSNDDLAPVPGSALGHFAQPSSQEIATPAGGIMTDEVGVITGDLEVRIEGDKAKIKYVGAAEEYTVSGDVDGRTLSEVVEVLVKDRGVDEFDNPVPGSLER